MSDAQSSGLPEGWSARKLGQLVQPSKAKVDPNKLPDAAYLSLEHIESGTGRIIGRGVGADVTSTKAVFNSGDILYGKLRPYLNKVCVPDFDGICSTDILVFEKTPAIESVLLRHFLSLSENVEYANHHSSGVQLPRVSFSDLAELTVPLPPRAEQERITAKIQTLLARVEVVRGRLVRILRILGHFRQSVLAAAYNGELTTEWRHMRRISDTGRELVKEISRARRKRFRELQELSRPDRPVSLSDLDNAEPRVRSDLELPDIPKEWEWVDLRFLMAPEEPFCYGVVQPGEEDPNGPRLIRVCDIEGGTVKFEQCRGISGDVHNQYARSMLTGGEVLVSVVGTIGRSAVAPLEVRGFNIARAVAKVPIRDFNERFVNYWLSAPLAQDWMIGDAREVARKTLNLEQLRTLPCPIPSLAEQHEIVGRIDTVFALADSISSRVSSASILTENIAQAVLSRAFKGELVVNEADLAVTERRDYETAEQMLARVADLESEITKLLSTDRVRYRTMNPIVANGGGPMRSFNKETVSVTIANMKSSEFSFEDLRKLLPGDYESLKQIVFELLTDENPTLTQRFDKASEEMKLARTRE